jgi:flagellar biosynthesis protein
MNERPQKWSSRSLKKAVALRYKPEEGDAPYVVAKGKGNVAEKILEKAREHQVPIQEDASLVEVLSAVELNQQIPEELYQLVAEVLSYVYRMDQRAKSFMDGSAR